jgi:hypothetical protein
MVDHCDLQKRIVSEVHECLLEVGVDEIFLALLARLGKDC